MASNYKQDSIDLDNLYQARTSTKRADVGIKVNGIDISNRYESISRDQRMRDADYSVSGTDLSDLFMGNYSQYEMRNLHLSRRTTAWGYNAPSYRVIHHLEFSFSTGTVQRDRFFEYGGRIIWYADRSGGSATGKNIAWTNALSTIGSIELGNTQTYQNGTDIVSTEGYSDLGNQFNKRIIFSSSIGGVYSSDTVTIEAWKQSPHGSPDPAGTNLIAIEVTFDAENPDGDTVDGMLNSYFDFRMLPDVPDRSNPEIYPAGIVSQPGSTVPR